MWLSILVKRGEKALQSHQLAVWLVDVKFTIDWKDVFVPSNPVSQLPANRQLLHQQRAWIDVDYATQLIGYDIVLYFGLCSSQFPQRSTLSRQLAIGRRCKFTATPLEWIDFAFFLSGDEACKVEVGVDSCCTKRLIWQTTFPVCCFFFNPDHTLFPYINQIFVLPKLHWTLITEVANQKILNSVVPPWRDCSSAHTNMKNDYGDQ